MGGLEMSYTHILVFAVGGVFLLGIVLCLAYVLAGDDGCDHSNGKGRGND